MSVPFVEIDIGLLDVFVATLHLVPITMTFAILAMFLWTIMADRRAATAAVTALAAASYFVNYLARIVDSISPLAWASPFNYYDLDVLVEGLAWWRTAVLLVLVVVLLVATLICFEKRDIGAQSTWRLPFLRSSRREADSPS